MADTTTITLKRNNDRNLKINAKKDGAAVDITGWVLYFSVKKSRTDSDADALIYKEVSIHTDPVEGESTIPIAASDTEGKALGEYNYDILAVDDQAKRQSSKTGKFQLIHEITDGDG